MPLGVIGIIYESRPGVTADAAALCLMAGNACLLRGGSEAARSNAVLLDCVGARPGGGGPAAQRRCRWCRRVTARWSARCWRAHGLIDVIIPRGGKGLVARVQAEARVPVLAHLDGINHVYVDASADAAKAVAIVVNSKLRRTAVCGAMETLLIDRAAAPGLARAVLGALADAGCEVRGAVGALEPRAVPAPADAFDTEYLDAIASVALVDGVEGAIAHIAQHGSAHTDAIVADDAAVAERFLVRGRQRHRAVERLDAVCRWRRIRFRRRNRHRHRPPARPRPGRAGRADDLQDPGYRGPARCGRDLMGRGKWGRLYE